MKTKNIIICGVGGQGIILASKVLSEALLLAGYDVKQSEVHGMSQRGGSVVSYIRFGNKVYSPLPMQNTLDYLISFEKIEALRYIDYLNKKSIVYTTNISLIPSTVNTGNFKYPENPNTILKKNNIKFFEIDILKITSELKNIKTANIVLLGFLAQSLKLEKKYWIKSIKDNVKKKFIDLNLKAFNMALNFK